MEIVHWKGILESLLFVAGDEGLSLKQISHVMEIEEFEAVEILKRLKEQYENDPDRGITLSRLR